MRRRAADSHLPGLSTSSPPTSAVAAVRGRGRAVFSRLWIASVGFPLVVLAVAAWWTWSSVVDDTRDRLARTVELLAENALRSFETQEATLSAVEERIRGLPWQRIEGSPPIHAFLRALKQGAAPSGGIVLIEPERLRIANSSFAARVPPTDLTGRDYVRRHQAGHLGTWVGEVVITRPEGLPVFTLSRGRTAFDGGFDGIIATSFAPDYFTRFYRNVAESPQDEIVLARDDGAVLTRWPAPTPGVFAPIDEAVRDAAIGRASGFVRARSGVDGLDRLYAVRRVGNYPVFSVYGLSVQVMRETWLRQLAPFAGVCLALLAALAGLTAQAQAQTTREREAEALGRELLERERGRAALAESEARLRVAKDAARFGIFDRDLVTGAIVWDDRLRNWWGLAPGTPVTHELFLARIHPEDRDAVARGFEQALRPDGDGAYRSEYRVATGDGGWRWMASEGQAFFDGQRPVRMVGTAVDITERKRLEGELGRRVAELQDADARKDEFLAMLAHELRSPLAPIGNAVRLLGREDIDPPRQRWALELVERQLGHLRRLVDDLLDVARITHQRIVLQRSALDFVQLVQQAVEARRAHLESRGQTLRLSLPEAAVPVRGDAVRLAQVVSNLLDNASKYTPDGGHVDVGVAVEDGQAVLRVRDDGVGISAQLLPQVFGLFVQDARSIERAQGGLGIGLSLVKRLVELHGGNVSAASDGPGKGSVFVVRLPVSGAT